MNETQWILLIIGAFLLGYVTAYFFKNMGKLWQRWGIFTLFLFPLIIMYLLLGGEAIANLKSAAISLVFALGFMIRMIKRDA